MKIMKRWIAGFALAAALVAQTAAPPSSAPPSSAPDTAALETYFRHLLMWPAGVEVAIGKPAAAPLAGFYRVSVRGTLGGKTQEEAFYVSSDNRTVIRGEVFDVKKSPFQTEIDLLKTDNQPFLGMPGAPVTIVEFADFQCPYCKQEASVVRTKLTEAFPGDVQLYFMDYPIEGHPFARGAAILGRCIFSQNSASFWAYHDWIFEHQAEITAVNLRDKAMAFAKGEKNLDMAKLTSCAVAQEPRDEVDRSMAIGDSLKIGATPTFFVNGRRLVGTIPLQDLKMVVEHEIAYAKAQKKATDCCSVQLALPGMGPVPGPPQ
jgi:protein-disulfide isomerase